MWPPLRGHPRFPQILSCLTDDIRWTVFGAFQLSGKDAYDKAIDGAPAFIDPPALAVVRMVEQGDVVMAELTGWRRAPRAERCACPWRNCS